LPDRSQRVCPVERAGGLDNKLRRWVHNPYKILGPFVKEGMTVMDVGCGPGLYAIEMALMVGPSGKVVAVDLQDGMLQLIRDKISGTEFEDRMILHRCEETRLGVTEDVDFALAFYMVHEVPDQAAFFGEVATILKPEGQLLFVEPPLHVSKSAFNASLELAKRARLSVAGSPKVALSKTALLRKG